MSNIHLARRGYINAGVPGNLERLRFVATTASTFLLTGSGTSAASNNYTVVDSSANNATVTRNGDTVQCGFSPFGTSYPGSMYFDGTGDYLTLPTTTNYMWDANQDFTLEAWIYLTATPGAQGGQIFGRQEYGLNSNYTLQVDSSRRFGIYINNGAPTYDFKNTTVLNLNQWYHVAAVRYGTGSNNNTLYVDGVGQSFTLTTDSSGGASGVWTLGADQAGDEARFTGFISNLRYVKGTAVYTGNFTPPTSPLTAVTNTQLLIKGDNLVGITDTSASGFPMLAYGNANLSTTQKKYGPTSLSLDGTGDGALTRLSQNSTAFNFGTGPFTIEAWVYNTNYNASQSSTIIGAHEFGTATDFFFGLATDGKLRFTAGATSVTAPSALTQNAWVHVAVVRGIGGGITLYQNGTSVATGTITASITASSYNVTVGVDNAGDESTFTGYIADIRVSKVAAYTENFTSPATTATSTLSGYGLVSNSTYGIYQLV
jgi:hypothetical protein